MPLQGLDIGDAVLTFVADTQDLDRAFDKLDETPEKLAPVGNALQGLSTYFGQVGDEAEGAAEKISEAGDEAGGSLREATGSAHLLGHAIGIHLPRQVFHFLGSLPALQPALAAAFSVVAVGFLAHAIAEVTEKVTSWIADTFIYTEAMKASNAEVVKTNALLLAQKDAYDKAKEAVESFGLSGAELTKHKIDELIKSMLENEAATRAASDTLYFYRNNLGATKEQAEAAATQLTVLTTTVKVQEELLLSLSQMWEKQKTEESVKAGESRIEAEKKVGEAEAALTLQMYRVDLAQRKGNYMQQVVVSQEYENTLYKIKMDALGAQIKEEQRLGKAGQSAVVRLQAEQEAETKGHLAKIFKSYADMLNKVNEVKKELVAELSPLGEEISNEVTKGFAKAEEAANALSIVLSVSMYASLEKAKKAFEDLKKTGLASQADLLKGQMALLKAQIEYDKELGKDVKSEAKALEVLQKAYDKLTHKAEDFSLKLKHAQTNEIRAFDQELQKSGKQSQAWGAATGAAISDVAQAYLEGSMTIGKALEQVAAAQLKAVAQIAFTKGTEQLAEGFGAWPDAPAMESHFESAGLWFALGGALSLAGGAMSGSGPLAGGGGSGPGSNRSGIGTGGGSSSYGGGGSGSVNIQHFAQGGLVTGPTLALMGEAGSAVAGNRPREAAIPLDDPHAVSQIKEAMGGGGHTIGVNVKSLISSDHLKKLVKQLNKGTRAGKFNLFSTHASRVVRKSM